MSKNIQVPKWIFEKRSPCCNRFLIGIRSDGTVDIDGCHCNPNDVAKALYLRKAIKLIQPKEDTQFFMITIEPVPEYLEIADRNGINHDAIEQLNHIQDALNNDNEPLCEESKVSSQRTELEQKVAAEFAKALSSRVAGRHSGL